MSWTRKEAATVKTDVLGVLFDTLNFDSALKAAQALVTDPSPRYAVTPNAEIVYLCVKNSLLREALNNSDLVLPDGIGVVKASHKLGRPLPERVPGVELGPALFPFMEREGKTLFLLGGKPGVPELAAERIKKEYPKLSVAGLHHGYFQDDEPVLALIEQTKPDVIFCCLGSPRQELFMSKNLSRAGSAFMLGLGGTIDILAGTAVRAPLFFQKAGLEWLYRLLRQPARIGRMTALPRFWHCVAKQKKEESI